MILKYNDLDHAVKNCLFSDREALDQRKQGSSNKPGLVEFEELMQVHKTVFLGKTDVQSTFCLVPLSIACFSWLIMCARNPRTKKWQYFVDKCLPFELVSVALFSRGFQMLYVISPKP